MCGGTSSTPAIRSHSRGLSPRVRGNPQAVRQPIEHPRSIPACAGGTLTVGTPAAACCALSPRVRGNPLRQAAPLVQRRSIPACAGEPSTPAWRCCVRWVYPRVCGGTYRARQVHAGSLGLSPRVRGNRLPLLHVPSNLRSIPACAGEPPWSNPYCTLPPVYPRVCGGTGTDVSDRSQGQGLSPRVRGNHARRRGCAGR